MPPATAFPQIFSKHAVSAKPNERKNTPAREADEPFPLSIMTINRSGGFLQHRVSAIPDLEQKCEQNL